MDSRQIQTGHGPTVIVECTSDLKIQGWAEPSVLIKGQTSEINEGEKALHIKGSQDLNLMIPSASTLTVVEVNGALAVKNVAGELEIAKAYSDVYIKGAGPVEMGNVHGDLAVSNLSGDLLANEIMGDASIRNALGVTISKVYGDCAVRNANGSIFIGAVLGDLSLRTVNGNVEIDEVNRDAILRNLGGVNRISHTYGDIRLRGGLSEGKHQFNADGDIVLRWPQGSPVDIQAAAPKISWRLEMADVQEEEGRLSARIGDSKVYLVLEAKGRIILKSLRSSSEPWDEYSSQEYDIGADISELGIHIAGEINNKLLEFGKRMEHQFGPEFSAKIELKAQQAARKAELAAEKAMRKAEKAARKAQWQSNRKYQTAQSKPTKQQSRVASEEEQLEILKMVEKGIISPEEANDLLAALDGK